MFTVFNDIIAEMRLVYQHDQRPWMLGFSDGKDSTLLCQLVFEMLHTLKPEERTKKIYVVTSDTIIPGSQLTLLRRNRQRIRKIPLKSLISEGFWSEWGDSNARSPGPKPMSEPSGSPVAPSVALSSSPAVPLWNSFALFVSGTAFVFWDLCGIEFCILKVLPTGFSSGGGRFLPQ